MTIAEVTLCVLAVCALLRSAMDIQDWYAIRSFKKEPAPPSTTVAGILRDYLPELGEDFDEWEGGPEEQRQENEGLAKIRLGARARAERNRTDALLREKSREVQPDRPTMSGRVGYDLDIGSHDEEYQGRVADDDRDEGGDEPQV